MASDWEERARSRVRELREYSEDDEDTTVTNVHVHVPPQAGKSERPPWERMPSWAKLAMSVLAASAGVAGAAKALYDALKK